LFFTPDPKNFWNILPTENVLRPPINPAGWFDILDKPFQYKHVDNYSVSAVCSVWQNISADKTMIFLKKNPDLPTIQIFPVFPETLI